jgi:hypothetical protein
MALIAARGIIARARRNAGIARQNLGKRRLRRAAKGGKPGEQSQQCKNVPRHNLPQIVAIGACVHSLCPIYCLAAHD